MKKFLKITGAFLLALILSAPGCEGPDQVDAQRDEAVMKAALDSIRDMLSSSRLADDDLRAFESAAAQKLSDLADYLNIWTDTSLDSTFRLQARYMIAALAIDGEQICKDPPIGRISIDSVYVIEPLTISGDSEYKGLLGAVRILTGGTVGQEPALHPEKITVRIIATRSAKPFGTDTLATWSLLLGEISPGL